MKHYICSLLVGCAAFFCELHAQNNNQLIIFLQHGRSMSEDFKRNALPEIKQFAQKENLSIKILDARDGAPKEVVFTPAIVYQNNMGQSVFRGRYRKVDQLEKFVANAKKAHQAATNDLEENTVAWRYGRATLAASMKMMPLTGKVPSNFDEAAFVKQAYVAMAAGMDYFKPGKSSELEPPVKHFSMEFYPEKTKEGILLIHMKLYSEFDKHTPVFVSDIPSGGEWDNLDHVFKKAGNRLEKMLIAQISNWDNGDGFDSLSEKTPVKSWKDLGFQSNGNDSNSALSSIQK